MFKVSPLFGDHAILPVGKELRIFGTADEGEIICARMTAPDGTVTGEGMSVAHEGRFLVHLPPQRLGAGTLTLTVTGADAVFTATDLCTGFLFMAGGQSNMEFGLQEAEGGKELIQNHDDPQLRYFNVPRVSVLDDAGQAAHDAAHWQKIEPHIGGDMSAVAYFFAREIRAKTGFPVGIIGCNWGGTSVLSWMDETALNRCAPAKEATADYERRYGDIPLDAWKTRQTAFEQDMNVWNARADEVRRDHPGIAYVDLVKIAGPCPWFPPPGPGSPYRPGQLHRTMVDKIAPMALSGILFYQGESDVERAEVYGELLITLVTRWRELFADSELPFYNVQLPMHIEANAVDDGRWAIMRHQQEKAWHALRESHLAVLIDGGEYGNIHPVDKCTPGERLARLFMENFAHRHPAQPWAMRKSTCGNVLTVELTGPVKALHGEPTLFEIAGEDGVYHPAQAELDWHRVHLTAEGVAHPVKVRYAFVNYAKVHVFSEYAPYLPLAPFMLEN